MQVVNQLQQELGISLQPAWLAQFLQQTQQQGVELQLMPRSQQLRTVWSHFLCCDLVQAGRGCLPEDLQGWHRKRLHGRYLLQLEEVVNMAAPAKSRYDTACKERCLKLLLTDGVHHVCAIEHRPLPAISIDTPAGCKVAVDNAEIRKGTLLLQPDNIHLLGGQVQCLEQARQRASANWTQPASGGLDDQGSPITRNYPLEASAAAWPAPAGGSTPDAPPALVQQAAPPGPMQHGAASPRMQDAAHGGHAWQAQADPALPARQQRQARPQQEPHWSSAATPADVQPAAGLPTAGRAPRARTSASAAPLVQSPASTASAMGRAPPAAQPMDVQQPLAQDGAAGRHQRQQGMVAGLCAGHGQSLLGPARCGDASSALAQEHSSPIAAMRPGQSQQPAGPRAVSSPTLEVDLTMDASDEDSPGRQQTCWQGIKTECSLAGAAAAMSDGRLPLPARFTIRGHMTRMLGSLAFRDSSGAPLQRYSLSVEITDGSTTCAAMLGHDVLHGLLGVSPEQLLAALHEPGRRQRVLDTIGEQNMWLAKFVGAMDLVKEHAGATPEIVQLR